MVVSQIMINNETTFYLGYVEQAIGGGKDPLSPSISISKNGSLAKWRGKLDFLNLRVNDPGLKNYKQEFVNILKKASELGIEVVITLPEYVPMHFEMAPELPPKVPLKPVAETDAPPKKNLYKRPDKLVHFKNCYLALPGTLSGNKSYKLLTPEDCFPIIEMAGEYGVKHIIVPVGEPGMFIDPQAEIVFKKSFKTIHESARLLGIKTHIRNGGISSGVFKKLHREFDCGLAYDVGVGQLECDDVLDIYRQYKDQISILFVQQAIQGFDKYTGRKDAMESALKDYITAQKDYKAALEENDNEYAEKVLKRYNFALKDYEEASLNKFFNLGLFQNGDLNLVPLLKEVRKDIEAGDLKYVLIEAVPNTRNNDFVLKNVLPGTFTGTF